MSAPSVLLYDYTASICCQMVRLTLAEKRVAYARQQVDIIEKAEQFEPWYTALSTPVCAPLAGTKNRPSGNLIIKPNV